VASREAATTPREVAVWRVALREATGKIRQLDGKIFFLSALGFCIWGVTHFIPGVLFVSANIAQAIPKMLFIVSADVSQQIPMIFCIDWLTSCDTNKAQPINKPPAHHYSNRAPQWRRRLFRLRAILFHCGMFSTFL
jgi:hypothetical protein